MNTTPEWATLRKQAIHLTDQIIHGYYEQTIHPKELKPWLSTEHFSWIGACEGEIYTSYEDAITAFSYQRDMKKVPPIEVGKIEHAVFPISKDVLLLVCMAPLKLKMENTLLAENQRYSFLFKLIDGRLKVMHIHTSNPWSLMPDKKIFPVAVSRANYELFHSRLAEKTLSDQPNLTERQKTILELLTQGRTYQTIAELLNITPRTVRYHVNELITKFKVSNKAELISKVKK